MAENTGAKVETDSPGTKARRDDYETIGKKFSEKLFSFIELRNKSGKKVPENKNELIALFLQETKKSDVSLAQEYEIYIQNVSGGKKISKITFSDLDCLPLGKDGRLSELLADRQANNFEDDKQETVFEIWKDHYTKAIEDTRDKTLQATWKELYTRRFGKEGMKKLIRNKALLPTLQKLFDSFFKEQCAPDKQKKISKFLQDGKHRPTMKTYLDAFKKAGHDIKNNNVKDALLNDKKKDGKKTIGVSTLDRNLAQLTQVTLMEAGWLARDAKKNVIDTFDNTFSHTEITKGIFKNLPREKYMKETKTTTALGTQYQQHIKKAKDEQEADCYTKKYEKELLRGYLERAHQTIKKNKNTTPRAMLIKHLATLSKLEGTGFALQGEGLKTTITTYLQEDYLEQQLDHDMIREKMTQMGIDPEKHFDNYLTFWKEVYNLDEKTATFKKDKKDLKLTFIEKNIVTHENKFTSVDNLDELFSFERTVDFEKSDPIFSTLFGTTPQGYIVDDKTGAIIDTLQEHEFAVYTGEPTLKNRLILSEKNKISITDTSTGKTYEGYPELNYGGDDEQPGPGMQDSDDTGMQLFGNNGNKVGEKIQLDTTKATPPSHEKNIHLLSGHSIEATSRTFTQPGKPPVVQQLIQTALFNEMDPKEKVPVRSVDKQANLLDPNYAHKPCFAAYHIEQPKDEYFLDGSSASDEHLSPEIAARIAKFSSYRFVGSNDIPQGIINEVLGRKPPKTKDEIKAWIDQGKICFHKKYFCKKYNLKDIDLHESKLLFTDSAGKVISVGSLREVVEQSDNIKNCVKELISAKTHEVTHRLLHFHGITKITTKTKSGKKITLQQEDLCEVADKVSHEWKKDKVTKRRFVEVHGEEIWVDDIESKIQKEISGFSWGAISEIDSSKLEEYISDFEKFTDLLVANTARGSGEATPPTIQMVNSSRQAMTRRLNTYLEQIDNDFDPSDEQQVQQRAIAQDHLDALTQQEGSLRSTTIVPTDEELAQMHQQHIETAQFLQQNRHTGQQPGRNEQNPTTQNQGTQQQTTQQQTTQSTETTDTNNTQETIEETNQENEPVTEKEKEKFMEGFNGLKGDAGASLEAGTVIFLKEDISEIPGRGFNRVKYTITSVHHDSIFMEMSDASEKKVTRKTSVELARTGDALDKLQKVGKNDVYKFGKSVATKGGFMNSIKSTLGGKRAEVDNFKKKTQTEDKTSKEAITHVGNLKEKIVSSDSAESVLYKVDRGSNYVTVSAAVPDGNKNDQKKKSLRTKKMDYDTFQMFCFTKSLNPLTSTEVKRSGERLNPENILSDGLPRQPISLAAIRKGLKSIPETYKKKFEEEQEFQAALATDYISSRIPNTSFLFLNEVKNDLSGTDGLIRNRIQKFKGERAETGDSDKASIHDGPISENIRDNIFKNIGSSRKYKYRAAGALLYALEKGGPYFRSMAEYEDKEGGGRWIKCLLGEDARQQFLQERQRKIDLYKSNGGSKDEIQSEIAKFELQFIQDATTDKPGRGSKFGREIESHKDTLHGGASSLDPSSISKKGDFPYMLDVFRHGGIGKNMPRLIMSSLEAMKAAVETPEHYSDFYMCILQVFATGMVHKFPQDFVNKLKGIGRSRGIPITLLAGDAHASGKSMKILDHISRNAGIKTFSEFSGESLDTFDAMHVHNYNTKKSKDIRDSFGNRWANYGGTIMDAFNYKNEHLINIPEQEDSTTRIVTDYLGGGGVFGGYKGVQDNESTGKVDGQSPFFEEGLLNLAKGPFRSYMMDFNNQGNPRTEHAITLWSSFSNILDQFGLRVGEGGKNTSKVRTKLLYNKFLQFFGENELSGNADHTFPESRQGKSYEDLFKKAITNEIPIEQFIRKVIFRERERDGDQDESYIVKEEISSPLVKQTILNFAGLIKKSYTNLTDITDKSDALSKI